MVGYEVIVDELEKSMKSVEEQIAGAERDAVPGELLFVELRELKEHYPMPSAFEAYMPEV